MVHPAKFPAPPIALFYILPFPPDGSLRSLRRDVRKSTSHCPLSGKESLSIHIDSKKVFWKLYSDRISPGYDGIHPRSVFRRNLRCVSFQDHPYISSGSEWWQR